ncbi:hypothetical protein SETIT_8G037200v2 [Setaria italica]|uniref:Transcription repressor n=1 Tax=Setaria italica TaxID=4555 RepID=K3ZIS4_SETIT|nr:uncharacterized protein DDB_G0271670 [Setaria italica]RCV37114.1 hypothetical protein SETIT_8G037200v2 [Setaria italica]
MGRKGGLAAIFSSKPKLAAADTPWSWPSCAASPQTASFRRQGRHDGDDYRPCTTAGRHRSSEPTAAAGRLRPPRKAAAAGGDDNMYKMVNSVYFDATDSCRFFFDDDGDGWEAGGDDEVEDGLDDGSFSTTTASEEWSEAVIRSLGRTSTDRFFFDAGPGTAPASNSILAASPSPPLPCRTAARATLAPPHEEAPKQQALPSEVAAAASVLSDDPDSFSDSEEEEAPASASLVEESVAVALDSEDPFGDFRASMEEMVSAHGLRDWPALQEMLLWYLRINGKHNHALIVGAFVDLLVGLATGSSAAAATTTTTTTTTTATMTATTTTSACSTSSSSSSASSSGGDAITTSGTAAAAAAAAACIEEQCGGGSAGASCSSSDLEVDDGEGR